MTAALLSAVRRAPELSARFSSLPAVAAAAVALAACATERAPQAVSDTAGVMRPVVTVTSVNDGTYGMIARVRWALSPDRRALVAVVNAVSVEAEALPDGFFFGVEEPAFAVQVDTVWDVAPAPDWRSVAFSRAYVIAHGESEVVPPEMWDAVARASGIDTATLRGAAFDASGMAYMKGIAQPAVITVPADPRATDAAQAAQPRFFPVPRGWRLRWTADGSLLALGSNPRMVQDDAPSESWSGLDPRTGAVSVALPTGTQLVEPLWVHGPELGIGMPVNVTDAPPITVRHGGLNYIIESQRGVISVRDPAFQTRAAIPVGGGVALAATAGGRYILAVRPRQTARQHEMPVEVVVYTVTL
ncbi:MAG TPA: hypothetical protein VMM17_03135 [Gemmatimonadaceae bacterium]|nr:hypothetical protein [Gemmatimonadaceae bacterium]